MGVVGGSGGGGGMRVMSTVVGLLAMVATEESCEAEVEEAEEKVRRLVVLR